MSILTPTRSKSKLFNEEIFIYALCILAYILLLSVVFQYYETIKTHFFKPDRLLLYLHYTGELLLIFLFSPIFTIKLFIARENKSTKIRPINIQIKTLMDKKICFKIIIKAFILIGIFHLISLFQTCNNGYFTYEGYFKILFMLSVFSLFIVAYTLFLVVISRSLCFSIAVVYLTIVSIFGCLFFISPLVDLVDNPTYIINLALNINPMMAIASLLNFDLLRWGPFYETAQIGMFRFSYPHWGVHVVSYLTLSIILFIGTFLLNNYSIKNVKSCTLL